MSAQKFVETSKVNESRGNGMESGLSEWEKQKERVEDKESKEDRGEERNDEK